MPQKDNFILPKIRLNLKLFLQFCAIFRKVFMLSLNFNYHQKFHVFIKFTRQILHKKKHTRAHAGAVNFHRIGNICAGAYPIICFNAV